jgi:hypothetical protein
LPLILEPALYSLELRTGQSTRIGAVPDFIVGSAFAGGKLYAFRFVLDEETGDLAGNDKVLEIDVKTGQLKELTKPGPCMGWGWGDIEAPAAAAPQAVPMAQQSCRATKGYATGARTRQ